MCVLISKASWLASQQGLGYKPANSRVNFSLNIYLQFNFSNQDCSTRAPHLWSLSPLKSGHLHLYMYSVFCNLAISCVERHTQFPLMFRSAHVNERMHVSLYAFWIARSQKTLYMYM